jgi:hypothetical protein
VPKFYSMGFLIWFALSDIVYAEAPVLSFFGECTEQEEAKEKKMKDL